MPAQSRVQDAILIGGGFYGAVIAIYLVKQKGFKYVTLIEKESGLLLRASYNNQARVHHGYHYPRSFTTAYRSRVNFPNFVQDWPQAIKKDFTKVYALARRNSRVTAKQFQRFCLEIGANVQTADSSISDLFDPQLIEEVFLADEYAFDSTWLATWARQELENCGVEILLNSQATKISKGSGNNLEVTVESSFDPQHLVSAKYIFNCSYAGLNQIGGDFKGTQNHLKQEITELALIQMPAPLASLGITVMDGPFFSTMPFPARGLHSLSHVRYTPHLHWKDDFGIDPYQRLKEYDCMTRVDRMIRDAGRYIPAILDAKYVDSLFEVKTVLARNEVDDGRPILFEKHSELPGCYSILGGKIDNIYDILAKLDAEPLNGENQ